MKHLMLMGAVLLLLLGGCDATIGGTDGYAVEAIVFSEDGSRGSREGTPERLVVVKVFDQDTREHIPADDGGTGAYDLFGRGEWVTRLTLDGGYWRGTVVLDPAISLEGRTLVFLLLGYPDITSEQVSRSGTGSPSGSSVTITTGDGFETGTAGVFGHGGINIGPAGGYIFYEKGTYSDSWRYLELGPEDLGNSNPTGYNRFGFYRTTLDGTNLMVGTTAQGIGTGKTNTNSLVATMGTTAVWYDSSTGSNKYTDVYAARQCYVHTENGYDDWFLPSSDELELVNQNLENRGLGNLGGIHYYWSSSEHNSSNALAWQFYDDTHAVEASYDKNGSIYIRPARSF